MRRLALLLFAASVAGGAACGISLDPVSVTSPAADSGIDASPPVVDASDAGPDEDAPPPDEDAGPFVPSNVVVGFEADDGGARDFPTTVTLISTGVGAVPPSLVPPPATAPYFAMETTLTGETVAVLRVRDFVVSTDVDVIGDHALVVIASGKVTISAVIKAGVDSLGGAGPGGFAGGSGPGKGGDGAGGTGAGGAANANSGGGGGGHGVAGAPGGDSATVGTVGGLAGGAAPANKDDVRLVGGSGGGSGIPNEATCSAPGGAGGGAVQISSLGPFLIAPAGRLDVGGGGGAGGCQNAAILGSGAGGGAGGLVLIEARALRIEGFVTANGGGGGGGATSGKSGQAGMPGPRAAELALGGTSGVAGSFVGGFGGAAVPGADGGVDGGAGDVPPTVGDKGAAAGEGAGGGGGYGRILLRVRRGGLTILGTGASPTVRMLPL